MDLPAQKKAKPPRSHWDMLMERRTIADLEEVLAERLAVIRERRGPEGDDRDARSGRGQQRKSA